MSSDFGGGTGTTEQKGLLSGELGKYKLDEMEKTPENERETALLELQSEIVGAKERRVDSKIINKLTSVKEYLERKWGISTPSEEISTLNAGIDNMKGTKELLLEEKDNDNDNEKK